jgi:hypothetical protein
MSDIALSDPAPPILKDAEVARRVTLLTTLQAALAAEGVQSVLVRNRRLVLRAAGSGLEPSGPTDPRLHMYLANGADAVTTDGTSYQLASGPVYPADNPRAVAATVRSREWR